MRFSKPSSRRFEGFENRIASLLARDLGAAVRYVWWPQRRGFARKTLDRGLCDVVLAVPQGVRGVLTTRPYYRSSYVFVTRAASGVRVRSFDDPALRRLRIGVQMIGDDGMSTPPGFALAARRIVDNVDGYLVTPEGDDDAPGARIVDAVAASRVDVAVVWGPMAGYFAAKERVPLVLTAADPDTATPPLPFTFAIAIGVRRDAPELRDSLDAALERRRADVTRILDVYRVPRVPDAAGSGAS